jgi:enoyl-CoA hydratase/carnithine racemase
MHVEDGSIRRVTFDPPDARNALTATVARNLADALADLNPAGHDAVVITWRDEPELSEAVEAIP